MRQAIHVGNRTFNDGTEVEKYLRQDTMTSVKPWLAEIMNHYKVRELLRLLSILHFSPTAGLLTPSDRPGLSSPVLCLVCGATQQEECANAGGDHHLRGSTSSLFPVRSRSNVWDEQKTEQPVTKMPLHELEKRQILKILCFHLSKIVLIHCFYFNQTLYCCFLA